MRAILVAKRFEDTGFSVDIEFRENNGTLLTTKTLSFSGAQPDISMQTVKDRVAIEAARLQLVLTVNAEPDAAIGTDLLA